MLMIYREASKNKPNKLKIEFYTISLHHIAKKKLEYLQPLNIKIILLCNSSMYNQNIRLTCKLKISKNLNT